MTTSAAIPFLWLPNLTGSGLEGGYVYVGAANTDPTITANRISIFSDAACTVGLSQPLRTSGGFVVNGSGTPVNVYVAGTTDFAITVQDAYNAALYAIASYPVRLIASSITFDTVVVNTSALPDAAGGAFVGSVTLPFSSIVAQDIQTKTIEVYNTTQPAVTADFVKAMQNRLPLMIARQTSTNPAVLVNIYNCASITRTAAGLYTVVPTVALPAAYAIWFQGSSSAGTSDFKLTARTTASFVVESYVGGVATDQPFEFHVYGVPAVADPIS